MATTKKPSAAPPAKTSHLITWAKLPKGVDVVVEGPKSPRLQKILKDAGLNPQARCFGGDTCIV